MIEWFYQRKRWIWTKRKICEKLDKLIKYNDYLNEMKDMKKAQKQILWEKKNIEKNDIIKKEKIRQDKIEK